MSLLIVVLFVGLMSGCEKTEDSYADNFDKSAKVSVNHAAHGLDQDRYVTLKETGLKVHYRIIGKGPIDMVFIPGWTNPLTVYTKQFDYFRDKARCIYIDLPGTGMSDAPAPGDALDPSSSGLQYTQELMADAVYAVVKKEGLHRFVGVGFSMGPKVLGMFERNYPGMIYKLVTIDGGFNPWPVEEAARLAYIDYLKGTYLGMYSWTDIVKTIVGASLIPPSLTGPLADELKEWGTYFPEFPSDILANTYYYSEAENANEPVGWSYPKLCFYSKAVEDLNMDKVNWIYPNNTVYGFPDGGHVIHWMFHEDINPLIWEFVKDRPGKKY